MGQLTFKDYADNVALLVTDKSKLTIDGKDIPGALKGAAAIYSNYRQRMLVHESTADGGRIYSLPTTWEVGTSEAGFKIEYPVDPDADEVQYLDPTMYSLYQEPAGLKIRFRRTDSDDLRPKAGEKFRVHYPVEHTCTEGSVTILNSDFAAFSFLAAAQLCLIMSSKLAQLATGNGSQVDYQLRSNQFLSIRKEFMADWERLMVPKEGEVKAGMKFGSMQTTELHRDLRPTPPRDNSGRQFVD